MRVPMRSATGMCCRSSNHLNVSDFSRQVGDPIPYLAAARTMRTVRAIATELNSSSIPDASSASGRNLCKAVCVPVNPRMVRPMETSRSSIHARKNNAREAGSSALNRRRRSHINSDHLQQIILNQLVEQTQKIVAQSIRFHFKFAQQLLESGLNVRR